MDFTSRLKKIAIDADKVLQNQIPASRWYADPMDASRYAALDAGKRVRTFLTVEIAGLFNAPYEKAVTAGTIVELVHNFSLIHDDLPCIDNDKLRRGKPSVWAKYGERNAVLAGDYLLNLAYQVLSDSNLFSNEEKLKMMDILSHRTSGMILGEWMDCEAENGSFQTESEIEEIQDLKTGCIFSACAEFGMVFGNASEEQAAAVRKFIDSMGLCFQITDDILDAEGDQEKVGKTLKKDLAAGKATYISLLGLDGAKGKALTLARQAKESIAIFDDRAQNLRAFMDYMVKRES